MADEDWDSDIGGTAASKPVGGFVDGATQQFSGLSVSNSIENCNKNCVSADKSEDTFDWGTDAPNQTQSTGFGSFKQTEGRKEFSGGDSRKGGTCYNCQGTGHLSRDCPNERKPRPMICRNCNEEGHMSRNCTNKGSDNSGGRSRTCHKCQQEGHFARECPNDANGPGADRKDSGCFKCGEKGHMARDCTNPPKEAKPGDKEERPPPHIPKELEEDELFGQGVAAGINFAAYGKIEVKASGTDVPLPVENFSQSGLREFLLKNVERAKYTTPTPIQKYAIPVIRAGRDLMACAQTGSGKTAAFLLPILHYVLENSIKTYVDGDSVQPIALIMCPTRELAIQTYNEARKFSIGSILKICVTYGGTSVSHQHRRLQNGCHILVATPGRLLDYVNKGQLSFESLQFLVLDEADRMLDMGFGEDVKKVVNHPTTPDVTKRQTLMFSATFSAEIQELAKNYLNNYIFVVVGMVGAANADVQQTVLSMAKCDKIFSLETMLADIIAKNGKEKILVFVETKRTADTIAAYLSTQGIQTTSIHGDRYQYQREEALYEFKTGIRNVLVATAVAARGLDIKGVGYVVNHDMPKTIDEYVHRIGRTGRVGNQGQAISYFDTMADGDVAKDLVKILSQADQEVPDWLKECAKTSRGPVSTFRGESRDIRKGRQFVQRETFDENTKFSAAHAFGGPSFTNSAQGPSAEDEESWD